MLGSGTVNGIRGPNQMILKCRMCILSVCNVVFECVNLSLMTDDKLNDQYVVQRPSARASRRKDEFIWYDKTSGEPRGETLRRSNCHLYFLLFLSTFIVFYFFYCHLSGYISVFLHPSLCVSFRLRGIVDILVNLLIYSRQESE